MPNGLNNGEYNMNTNRALKIIQQESDKKQPELWRSSANGERRKISVATLEKLRNEGLIEIEYFQKNRPYLRLTEKGWLLYG